MIHWAVTNFVFSVFSFAVNENLRKVTDNLTIYIEYESWKCCNNCHIVELNKILPTFGNQKLTHLTNCICTKGRYFVPMICIFSLPIFFCYGTMYHVNISYLLATNVHIWLQGERHKFLPMYCIEFLSFFILYLKCGVFIKFVYNLILFKGFLMVVWFS